MHSRGLEPRRLSALPPQSRLSTNSTTRAKRSCDDTDASTAFEHRCCVYRSHPAQPINGTLVDVDTGLPIAAQNGALLNDAKEPTGDAVITNERGEFTVQTSRSEELRPQTEVRNYLELMSPPLLVSADELVIVRLFVSAREGVLAPLGVSARVRPQDVAISSVSGFSYRRDRGVPGDFFRASEIVRTNSQTIGDFLNRTDGVAVRADAGGQSGIILRVETGAPECAASIYLDAVRVNATTITAFPASEVFGVEVYSKQSQIPLLFRRVADCGVCCGLDEAVIVTGAPVSQERRATTTA